MSQLHLPFFFEVAWLVERWTAWLDSLASIFEFQRCFVFFFFALCFSRARLPCCTELKKSSHKSEFERVWRV